MRLPGTLGDASQAGSWGGDHGELMKWEKGSRKMNGAGAEDQDSKQAMGKERQRGVQVRLSVEI